MATCAVTAQKATVRFDTQTRYQRVTGFGGFVCSPQFGYGHMSETEIKKVWGASSTIGCNIMRLYLPVGEGSWGQSLSTAKLAKKLGLIVFASPWGQPKEWKTNNSINASENGVVGSLKKENWKDYAEYLEKYVQYLRKNGVELDAISIQNEPDWTPTYAGCKWTSSEMAEFVKTYGKSISCKVITPESIGCSDGYVNALNKTDVLDCFDIYGGHQYGGIQTAYKNLAKKGKEIWMTEYLINWNENQSTSRNFDFTKDFFNFFRAINTCMLGDFNAWIHYAAKRFYAMLGDGQNGAGSSGTVTKRGYIMAHFAKFVTGMTRIGASFPGGLEGSAYQSQTGDTIVAVMANATDNPIEVTIDLPFYTQQGELRTTGKSQNFKKTALTFETEACRPIATVAAQSVVTVMFVKSRDRQPSDMKGSVSYFDRKLLDEMTTTKSNFGTAYKLTNKTGKKFDSDNPLISSRKTLTYGYIALDDRYTQLVMHIKKVTTTSALTAGATTLYYVNDKGEVANHVYGRMDLSKGEEFDLVFDLSPATLADGCIGLLSLTCDNTQSHLTINFGDVYLTSGNTTYAATLSGAYVADDSNVLEYSTDPACTSIDMTAVTGLPATLPWLERSNRVVYVTADCTLGGSNVVKGTACEQLTINEAWGPFRPATPFTATQATYTCEVNGQHIVQLPFQAAVAEGINVYTLTEDLTPVAVTTVPANKPILVEGHGEVTFTGGGEVSYAPCPLSDDILPITTTGMDVTTAGVQPKFSRQHGLIDGAKSISVAITGSEGGDIYYTTDGSKPTKASKKYTAPLQFRETTILRAIEVTGESVSPIATASYIFTGSVLSQPNDPEGYPAEWGEYTQQWGTAIADYEMDPEMTKDAKLSQKIVEGLKQLPILSIVSDKDNFFSHENDSLHGGIYIFTGPPVGDGTGHGWTRPASVELFGGPQNHELSTTCGVRLHGGHGRLAEKNPKHSFRLVFKKEYGQKTLKYPLFGEDEPSQFDQLVLRCHFGNAWQHWAEDNRQRAQYTRDVWARMIQKKMGRTSVNALYVHLFINGMYWGLYNIAERVDDQYGKDHLGGKKSDIDVIKIEEDGGSHIEASEGTLDAWEEMLATVKEVGRTGLTAKLDTLLDIDNFIDYMLINQYAGNTDWNHHNWFAIRRHNNDEAVSEGFRFLCWDSELILMNVNENVASGAVSKDKEGYITTIYRNLLKNEEFAHRYARRAKQLLAEDGLLGEKSVVEVWDSLYYTIDKALYAEAARWGDYRRDVHPWQSRGKLYTVDNFYLPERNRLLTQYFPYRSDIVFEQILKYLGTTDIADSRIRPTSDGRYYNMNGQVVDRPTKGIYIKNGKKVIVR